MSLKVKHHEITPAGLTKPIKVETGYRHVFVVKRFKIYIRLPINPEMTSSWDDKFILFENKGGKKRQTVLTVKDDLIPGDAYVDFLFPVTGPGCTYSLQIDPGKEGEPYYLFEDMDYNDIAQSQDL